MLSVCLSFKQERAIYASTSSPHYSRAVQRGFIFARSPQPAKRETESRKKPPGGADSVTPIPPKLNGGQRSGRCFDVQTIAIAAICSPFCSGSQDGGPRARTEGVFYFHFLLPSRLHVGNVRGAVGQPQTPHVDSLLKLELRASDCLARRHLPPWNPALCSALRDAYIESPASIPSPEVGFAVLPACKVLLIAKRIHPKQCGKPNIGPTFNG